MYYLVRNKNWLPSTEILDATYLRVPPPSDKDVWLIEGDSVEVFYQGGWSSGSVSKILREGDSCKYKVKMNAKSKDPPIILEFDAQYLRPRFNWTIKAWKRFSKRTASRKEACQLIPTVQSSNSKSTACSPLTNVKQRKKERLGSKKSLEMAKCKIPISNDQKTQNVSELITLTEKGHETSISINDTYENASDSNPARTSGVGDEDNSATPIFKELPEPSCSDDSSRIPPQESRVAQHDVIQREAPSSDLNCFPFEKTFPLWASLDEMEVFKRLPQQPHFQQVQKNYSKSQHEGVAFGLLMSFVSCVERIEKMQMKDDTEVCDMKRGLDILEANGFNVQLLKSRLCSLLSNQEALEESRKLTERLEKKILQKENENRELDLLVIELGQTQNLLQSRLNDLSLKRSCNDSELRKLEEEFYEVCRERELAGSLISSFDVSLRSDEAQAGPK